MDTMSVIRLIRNNGIDLNQSENELWWDIIEAANFSLETCGDDMASELIGELMGSQKYYIDIWEEMILPALKNRRAQGKIIDPFRVIYVLVNYHPGKHKHTDIDMIKEHLLSALGLYHQRMLPEEVVAYLKAEELYPEEWIEEL
jgi:hypothetical protein